MAIFIINGAVFSVIGFVFVVWPTKVLKATARLGLAWYPEDSWLYRVFDRTPFGAIQKQMVGLNSRKFIEEAAEDPSAFGPMLWWIRILGGITLLFGVPFFVGGWVAVLA